MKNKTYRKGTGSKQKLSKKKYSKTKKDHKFEAQTDDKEVIKMGSSIEFSTFLIKMITFVVLFIAGVVFTFLDFRDEGLSIEFGNFKLTGTIVGVVLIIMGIMGILLNKTDIKISK